MSLSDEERHAIVLYRIEKANAASALLIHDGHKVGTHKGVIPSSTSNMSRKALYPEKMELCSRIFLRSGKAVTMMTLLMQQKRM